MFMIAFPVRHLSVVSVFGHVCSCFVVIVVVVVISVFSYVYSLRPAGVVKEVVQFLL